MRGNISKTRDCHWGVAHNYYPTKYQKQNRTVTPSNSHTSATICAGSVHQPNIFLWVFSCRLSYAFWKLLNDNGPCVYGKHDFVDRTWQKEVDKNSDYSVRSNRRTLIPGHLHFCLHDIYGRLLFFTDFVSWCWWCERRRWRPVLVKQQKPVIRIFFSCYWPLDAPGPRAIQLCWSQQNYDHPKTLRFFVLLISGRRLKTVETCLTNKLWRPHEVRRVLGAKTKTW